MAMNVPNFAKGIDGLLPAIAQDAISKQVLMFAWMNTAAYQESLKTGFATYFSRSRNRLWRKGEESGHRQRIVEIRVDCDADCILMLVEQSGAACHEGYASCFFRKHSNEEFVVDQVRIVDPGSVYQKAEG
ncbi:MAG: phosphoribosyl-AMP cyclohydrolase [Planctomycetota bacterium]|nr:phosphoribosyl-AMP cyclohydrolase [Planctomycetota bacterium]